MNCKTRMGTLSVVLGVLLAGTVRAEAPPTLTLDEQVAQLRAVAAELKAGQSDLKLETDAIQAQLSNTQKDMAALASAMVSLDSQLNEVKRLLAAQTDTLKALADVQQRLRPADERPSLNPQQQDPPEPPSQRPVGPAAREGIVRIHNEMTSAQTIAVNGRRYRVPAESVMDISVPLGLVTTELSGYEAAKEWTIAKPGDVQEINIYPTNRTVVERVVMPSVVYDYSY